MDAGDSTNGATRSRVLARTAIVSVGGAVLLATIDVLVWVLFVDPSDPGTTGYIDPVILVPQAGFFGLVLGLAVGSGLAAMNVVLVAAIERARGRSTSGDRLSRLAANVVLGSTVVLLALGALVFGDQLRPNCGIGPYVGQCSDWGVDRNRWFFLGALVLPALLWAGVVARAVLLRGQRKDAVRPIASVPEHPATYP